LGIVDPSAYYRELLAADYRSTAGRYNRLNDDIRNDVVRIGLFSTSPTASSKPTANARRRWR
jgi:hypothetical protein